MADFIELLKIQSIDTMKLKIKAKPCTLTPVRMFGLHIAE